MSCATVHPSPHQPVLRTPCAQQCPAYSCTLQAFDPQAVCVTRSCALSTKHSAQHHTRHAVHAQLPKHHSAAQHSGEASSQQRPQWECTESVPGHTVELHSNCCHPTSNRCEATAGRMQAHSSATGVLLCCRGTKLTQLSFIASTMADDNPEALGSTAQHSTATQKVHVHPRRGPANKGWHDHLSVGSADSPARRCSGVFTVDRRCR